jgi:MFS transporter, UMF1 family
MAGGHAPTTDSSSTARPASRLGQISWALFDWANQPFFTLITTFIFGPYFAGEMVGGLQEAQLLKDLGHAPAPAELAQIKDAASAAGQAALAFTQSAAGILLALLSPFLGSMADITGRRKPYILIFQSLTAIGCAILWFATPGNAAIVPAISFALILATIGAEFSIVFNNAQLPVIVEPNRIGWLSGLGWGLGYTGGLLSLFAVLAVRDPAMLGLAPAGSPPLFGLDPRTFEIERLIGPASALWLAIFVIPMFLFTPDGKSTGVSPLDAAREGARNLWATIRKAAYYRNPFLFLIAYMIYNDGLAAIIAFGGVYAKGIFGWSTVTLGIFGIIITIAAIPGCLLGGKLDDRIGSRRLVLITTVGVIIAALGILSVSASKILFVISAAPLDPARGMFGSAQELAFMAFALLLGSCMGPMQAGSRTLMGRLAPEGMSGEFYGLFALSGRATAWMAPTAIAIVTTATETQRWGVAIVIPFLVIGLCLLWFVREERASAAH